MLELGKFSSWITIGGVPLQEYDITTKGLETTCWIPSEAGKSFAVHYESKRQLPTGIEIFLDGKRGRSKNLRKAWKDSVDGILTSSTSIKPFLFSRLDLTDDDAFLSASYQQIGEIKVEFWDVLEVRGRSEFKNSRFSEPGKVHERSKKAIGHQISLAEEQSCVLQTFSSSKRITLLATMIFRYRPLDVLQANGIAPPPERVAGRKRAAPPDEVLDLTLSGDDTGGEGDAEEIEALEARLAAIRNKRRKVSVKTEVKTEPGVKREPGMGSLPAKARKGARRTGNDDVIDLT
ncbi:hypothetical protein D9758_010205 [Tetrapyrgos nigripes]|uniref:DUF7918 domain-containing protein n=1 Tax=Tetrapyrgos nigripes TaxID=182062 RepID=A0A8H5CXK2_9AGAR|nr:hypothetical protein D9758_010205 [Tetrapyrgos nigripes]